MAHIIDGAPKLRIGFFLRHEFHRPNLEPIAHALYERGHAVRVTPQKWKLILFNPHVMVAGESLRSFRFHWYLPFTRFVHIRHGLASNGVAAGAASFSHYTCVTSHPMKDWYIDHGVRPRCDFWVTGYPQMDPLFQPGPLRLPIKIPPRRKVILYAPTFQHGFTSIHMLAKETLRLLGAGKPDTFVVIKPHPLIARHHPEWLETIRAEAASRKDVHVTSQVDTDLMPYLKAADVLVSDVSSAMLEYLALDRPIVLLTNPDHKKEPFYDPDGFEWRWRDAARELSSAHDLPAAINQALSRPGELAWRRRQYRHILFGDLTDGRATERVSNLIANLEYETAGAVRMALTARLGRLAHAILRRGRDIPGNPRRVPVSTP